MNRDKFIAVLELVVCGLVDRVMHERGLNDIEALKLVYGSHLYRTLEREETKAWHLSAVALYDLLDEELRTGHITWPEEA